MSANAVQYRLGAAILLLAALGPGCGDQVEDNIDRLGGSPEEREQGRQELLLAKERAVEPLLAALERQETPAAVRGEVADMLFGLRLRVADTTAARIAAVLVQHLTGDPDPAMRARLAYSAGLHKVASAVDGLLRLLADDDAAVRAPAIQAAARLTEKMDDAQRERFRAEAQRLQRDPDPDIRLEAMIQVEDAVHQWVEEARLAILRGNVAQAESLLAAALEFSPHSKQALYRQGRLYLDTGQREKGLSLLRQRGMLLDVPRLSSAPTIDGRVDEAAWGEAARIDSFFQRSREHFATPPATVAQTFWVGCTRDALFIGFRGHDDHPDSLRVGQMPDQLWYDDYVEFLIDSGFDHRSVALFEINSAGTLNDSWIEGANPDGDRQWSAGSTVATCVGPDYWSMEFRLPLGSKKMPRPRPGEIWGAALNRIYRGGRESAQWVPRYSRGQFGTFDYHVAADDYGLLLFH